MNSPGTKIATLPVPRTEAAALPVAPAVTNSLALIAYGTPVLLGASAFALGLFPIESRYLWGEASYLATADNLFSFSPYLDGTASLPPLLPLLLHAGSRVMSLDVFCRVLGAAFFAAAVVLLYLLGRKLYGYTAGLCAAILMLASPFSVFWAHKVIPEIPATALLLGSVYLLFLQLEQDHKSWWRALLSGALFAAAFMMQWITALAVIVPLYFVFSRRLKLEFLGYGLASLAAVAPYLVWAKNTQGAFVWPVWQAIASQMASAPTPDRAYYWKAILIVAGPLALFGVLGYLYGLALRQKDELGKLSAGVQAEPGSLRDRFLGKDLPLLLWFLSFVLCLSLAPHKENVYILPAIPALFLLAGRGFGGMTKNALGKLALVAVPAAIYLMATHLAYFQTREKWMDAMLESSGETRAAMLYMKESTPGKGVIYSNHLWPVAAYFSKQKTIALWPRDGRFYRVFPKNMTADGFFIYYRDVGKEPGEDWVNERPEFRKLQDLGAAVLYSYKYSGQGAITPEIAQRIDQAKGQFQAGAYDQVVESLSAIRVPDAEVSSLLGWSFYRTGKIAEAADAFHQGLRAEADNPRNLIGLGYCELRLANPQSAQQHFRAALTQAPDSVDAMVGLGLASMRLGDNATAEEQFRNALRIDPKNEEIRGYLNRFQAP
jgi:4-amino-4-deoxy-L-arabinose transferase-like glycosyltransferase/Flp pilus assembly protein TadD